MRLCTLLVIALLPTAVLAQRAVDQQAESGNWLHEQYQGFKVKRSPEQVVYAYYVSGVVDAEIRRGLLGDKQFWCQPPGALMTQYFDIVGRYLEAHRERRYILRAGIIVEALAEAWPCK
jgi:Rap1a immunity proteins